MSSCVFKSSQGSFPFRCLKALGCDLSFLKLTGSEGFRQGRRCINRPASQITYGEDEPTPAGGECVHVSVCACMCAHTRTRQLFIVLADLKERVMVGEGCQRSGPEWPGEGTVRGPGGQLEKHLAHDAPSRLGVH